LTGRIDAVTLTSASCARFFCERILSEGAVLDDLRSVIIACIGPVTAEEANSLGLKVRILAGEFTVRGLIDEIVQYYRRNG